MSDDFLSDRPQSFVMKLEIIYNESSEIVLGHPSGIWLNKENPGASYAISFDLCPITGDIFVSLCATASTERRKDSLHRPSPDDKMNPFSIYLIRIVGSNLSIYWSRYYTTDDSHDLIANAVKVTSNGQYIIMGGTTRGSGLPFGGGVQSNGDLDGYVTKINTSDGSQAIEDEYYTSHELTHTARISSNPLMDDSLESICLISSDEPYSSGFFYAVGSTEGLMTQGHDDWKIGINRAYIKKYDIDTMNNIWAEQIGYFSNGQITEGLGCILNTVSSQIYLFGNSRPSTQIGISSDGPDYASIFIASFSDEIVKEIFSKQYLFDKIESSNSMFSSRGAIDLDGFGNAFVTGAFLKDAQESVTVIKFDQTTEQFIPIFEGINESVNNSINTTKPNQFSAIQIIALTSFILLISFALFYKATDYMYHKEKNKGKSPDNFQVPTSITTIT